MDKSEKDLPAMIFDAVSRRCEQMAGCFWIGKCERTSDASSKRDVGGAGWMLGTKLEAMERKMRDRR
jgi:hypothetical protein